MYQFIFSLSSFLQNPTFSFIVLCLSFIINAYLLSLLIPKGFKSTAFKIGWMLIVVILIGTMFKDFSMISKYARKLFLSNAPYNIHIFFVRIAWAGMIIQFQALSLFIESLIHKKLHLSIFQIFMIIVNGLLCAYFIFIALFDSSLTEQATRIPALYLPFSIHMPLEIFLTRYSSLYMLFSLIIPTLIYALYKLRSYPLPKILRVQLCTLIIYFLSPRVIFESIIGINKLCKIFFQVPTFLNTTPILNCCILLSCYSIYYCINKILGLRFLNFNSQIDAPQRLNFINSFKETLDELGKATHLKELKHITQQFFNEAFDIAPQNVSLIIREHNHLAQSSITTTEQFVEEFMHNHDQSVCTFIKGSKILIYEELEFNNFYEEDAHRNICIKFLDHINTDLFLPIYRKDTIIAYVIIARNARPNKLYSIMDKNEMTLFASYLGNIINLIQHRNFQTLIQQEQELKVEISNKEKEIIQYKESLRSFIKANNRNDVGILFYKNRRFIFGNQAAKELIKININMQEGHPLTKLLRSLAIKVSDYKAPQSQLFTYGDEYNIMLCAVPNLERNNVIITIYHPDISDVLKKHIGVVHDPSKWDYLLYLETTKSGQLINQLLPSSGTTLLNLKIDLLKLGITNNALLIDAEEEDIDSMVELIHHISMRTQFKKISFNKPVSASETLIQLFGINSLFAQNEIKERPLMEQLSENGTLYIEHINYLDYEVQKQLADYIKTGHWKPYRSEQIKTSDVRIICSIDHTYHKNICSELYQELNKASITIPSLSSLPEQELLDLAKGFSSQKMDPLTDLMLQKKEINQIIASPPLSFLRLKNRVQTMIAQRPDTQIIDHHAELISSAHPELSHAAHLGKQALKDERLMHMLWDTFKNQTKIASFLGVNRSSVNRRCKIYNFQ